MNRLSEHMACTGMRWHRSRRPVHFRAGPRRVRATLLAALDHWLILANFEKAPEAAWLKQVLALADSDPWRQGVRCAREK